MNISGSERTIFTAKGQISAILQAAETIACSGDSSHLALHFASEIHRRRAPSGNRGGRAIAPTIRHPRWTRGSCKAAADPHAWVQLRLAHPNLARRDHYLVLTSDVRWYGDSGPGVMGSGNSLQGTSDGALALRSGDTS